MDEKSTYRFAARSAISSLILNTGFALGFFMFGPPKNYSFYFSLLIIVNLLFIPILYSLLLMSKKNNLIVLRSSLYIYFGYIMLEVFNLFSYFFPTGLSRLLMNILPYEFKTIVSAAVYLFFGFGLLKLIKIYNRTALVLAVTEIARGLLYVVTVSSISLPKSGWFLQVPAITTGLGWLVSLVALTLFAIIFTKESSASDV